MMTIKTHKRIYITQSKVFRNMLFKEKCFYFPRNFVADTLIKEGVAIDVTKDSRPIEEILNDKKDKKKKKKDKEKSSLLTIKKTEL